MDVQCQAWDQTFRLYRLFLLRQILCECCHATFRGQRCEDIFLCSKLRDLRPISKLLIAISSIVDVKFSYF